MMKKRMLKDAIVVIFNALSQHSPLETEENHKKPQPSNPSVIRTRYLRNTSLVCYRSVNIISKKGLLFFGAVRKESWMDVSLVEIQ
jgi:hypothetical protein